MTEHIRQLCGCDRPTCNVCQLFLCSVCGGFEGSLLPECPGKKLSEEEHNANYKHYCAGTGPFYDTELARMQRARARKA